jgi:hypothetical protein
MVRHGILILSVAGALLCAACHSSVPKEAKGGAVDMHAVNSFAMFGSANSTEMGVACAGRVELKQGSATVKDACFSGDTNVVVCTDATAPNAVMCAPGKDALSVAGTGSDAVSYARVK